jgi:hypothetical protein
MIGVRRIGTAVVALLVGAGTAHAYAGHGGANGTYCQLTLDQNHKLNEALESATSDVFALLNKDAADLAARGDDTVKPDVRTAGHAIAQDMAAAGRATSADAFDAAMARYSGDISILATACNTATGQYVGVEDTDPGTKA